MPPGSVLRIGVVDPVGAVDPRTMADATTILLARQIFDSPYQATAGGTATPALFSEPLVEEPGSGGLRFSAAVHEGLTFSNGDPAEARAVAAALSADPVFTSRATATAVGHRVHLTLAAPNPRFDLFLTMCGMLFREAGGGLVGTGPYMLGPSDATLTRLVPNPHGRVRPKIESVEVRHYPVDRHSGRPLALLEALEKGEVDLAPRLSWRDINTLKKTAVVMKPVNSTCFLYINNDRFTDQRVRLAIATAIDRTTVAEIAFGENPLAFRATGLLPPALGKTNDRLMPDAERARSLFQEAGGVAREMRVLYSPGPRPYLPAPAAVAKHIRDRVRRLGASIDVDEMASSDLIKKLNSGDYDFALMGNIPDSPDASDYLAAVIGSDAVPGGEQGASFAFNFARYRSSEMDALIAAYRKERRDEILVDIGQLLGRDVPLVPLLYGRACVAHSWRLRGFQPAVTGLVDLATLTLT